MAYVAPSGKIELMKNVPLTPDYNHTYWFGTAQTQYNYFTSKVFITLNNQMYTRVSNGVCRIEGEAELLKECNYMRFNNYLPQGVGVTTKNYYAFITNVEYINHNVAEISFQIDEIQTWMFETTFQPCFIERQHGVTDDRGDNIVPEPLQCGDYVVNGARELMSLGAFKYILLLGTYTVANNPVSRPLYTAQTFSGLYSGAKYLIFNTADDVRKFMNAQKFTDGLIHELADTGDVWTPLCLFAFPSNCIATGTADTLGGVSCNLVDSDCYVTSRAVNDTPTNLGVFGDTYTPKNKKLLTYPFSFFKVDLGTESKSFKYENCTSPNAFGIVGTVNPTPEIKVWLQGYNGMNDPNEYSLALNSFPNLNLYESGIFAGAGQLLGNVIKTGITAYATSALGSEVIKGYTPYFTTTELANVPPSLGNDYMRIKHTVDTKTTEDSVVGYNGKDIALLHDLPTNLYAHNEISVGGDNGSIASDMANHMLHLNLFKMSIKKELAIRFDQFLSKYGYAQMCVATPNVHARARWTYIKTKGCLVTGTLPTSARVTIQNALDRGITYWVYGTATVGQYGDFTNEVLNG